MLLATRGHAGNADCPWRCNHHRECASHDCSWLERATSRDRNLIGDVEVSREAARRATPRTVAARFSAPLRCARQARQLTTPGSAQRWTLPWRILVAYPFALPCM